MHTPGPKSRKEGIMTVQQVAVAPGDLIEIRLNKLVAQKNRINTRVLEGRIERVTGEAVLVKAHAAVRQAQECHVCGRDIDHPASRLIGIGPVCSAKLGYPWVQTAKSLTEAQIAEIRASVQAQINGTWWFPRKNSQITILEDSGNTKIPFVSGPPRDVTVDAKGRLVFSFGSPRQGGPDWGQVKDAVKSLGARFNQDGDYLWKLVPSAELNEQILDLVAQFAFTASDEVADVLLAAESNPELSKPLVRRVTLEGNTLRIAFGSGAPDPDFKKILDAVKSLPGRRYDPDTKTWTVGRNVSDKLAIRLQPFSFEFPDGLGAKIVDARQERRDNYSASKARDYADELPVSFPVGLELRPFQKAGFAFILNQLRKSS